MNRLKHSIEIVLCVYVFYFFVWFTNVKPLTKRKKNLNKMVYRIVLFWWRDLFVCLFFFFILFIFLWPPMKERSETSIVPLIKSVSHVWIIKCDCFCPNCPLKVILIQSSTSVSLYFSPFLFFLVFICMDLPLFTAFYLITIIPRLHCVRFLFMSCVNNFHLLPVQFISNENCVKRQSLPKTKIENHLKNKLCSVTMFNSLRVVHEIVLQLKIISFDWNVSVW